MIDKDEQSTEGGTDVSKDLTDIYQPPINTKLDSPPALVMVPVLPHTLVATVLVLSSMCTGPLRGQRPAQVDPLTVIRANPQCWDSSSALLLEMRSPRIADTVPAFWDMMSTLRSSDNGKHAELFWDLARVFWDLYLDCVLSKSHGLGRRHTSTLHSRVAGILQNQQLRSQLTREMNQEPEDQTKMK